MLNPNTMREQYSKLAGIYDLGIVFWKLWGADNAWRKKAVQALQLQPGDTVLELGCGTGLNFPFLQEAVGPFGKIIAVDLTPAMLAAAQKMIARYGWDNVELIEADASQLRFPKEVNGILSTFAMAIMPDHDRIIERCAQALHPGGRLVILDSKLTTGFFRFLNPLGLRLARPLGVTTETIRWEPWKTMREDLTEVEVTEGRLGFVYIASGTKGKKTLRE